MSTSEKYAAVSEDIDLASLGGALWRAKGWIAGVALGAGVVTFIGLSMMRPLYTSEARILVQNEDSAFTRPAADQGRNGYRTTLDEQAVQSQVQVLTSRDLILKVVKDLDLVHNPVFARDAGETLVTRLLKGIGLGRSSPQSEEERAANALADHLDVFQLSKSSVISVEYTSGDPSLAAKVANKLADVYLGWQRTAKIEQTKDATAWLDAQIKSLRTATAASEEAVEAFRAKQGLYAGTNNVTLNAQQLSELNSQLILSGAQKSEAHARAELIKKMLTENGDINATPAVLKSQLIINLIEQRVEVQRQLAELSATLLPSHPRIQQLRSELADVRAQIRDEAGKVVKSLENEAAVAAAREASLKSSLNAAKSQSAGLSDAEIKLRALEREAKANRDLLESYLARYRDASARHDMGAAPAQATIVSRAHASVLPSFPKRGAFSALVMAAVALLAIATTLARELLATSRYEPPIREQARPRRRRRARTRPEAPEAPGDIGSEPPPAQPAPARARKRAETPAESYAPERTTDTKPVPSRNLPVLVDPKPRQTTRPVETRVNQPKRQPPEPAERTRVWRAAKPTKRPSWLNVNETASPKPKKAGATSSGPFGTRETQRDSINQNDKPKPDFIKPDLFKPDLKETPALADSPDAAEKPAAAGLLDLLRQEFVEAPEEGVSAPIKNARFMDRLLDSFQRAEGEDLGQQNAARAPESHTEGAEMAALSPNNLRHYLTQRIATSPEKNNALSQSRGSTGDPESILKSFDQVLEKVLTSVTGGLPRALLVSGTSGKADATHTAITLARAMVDRNEQAVLVDLAKGASVVSGALGMPRVPGFADLAAGRASFTDVVRVDDHSPLQVITAGNPTVRYSEPEPESFMRIFEALTQTYDSIILHADPQAIEELLPALKFELPIMVAVVPPRARLEKEEGALTVFRALGCPVVIHEAHGKGRRAGLLGRIAAV